MMNKNTEINEFPLPENPQSAVLLSNRPTRKTKRRKVAVDPAQDAQAPASPNQPLALGERQFKALADTLPDIIMRLDRQFCQVYVNSAIEQISEGRPVSFLIGKPVSWLDSEQLERWNTALSRVFDTGQPQTIELSFPQLDAPPKYFQTWLGPEWAENPSGQQTVQYVFAVHRDVTELKLAQQQLRRQEHEFRSLAENIPMTLCRFDRELRYTYVNPVVLDNTSIPAELYFGKTSRELGLIGEKIPLWENAIQQVFATGEKQVVELEYPDPEGEPHYYQSTFAPSFESDGRTVASVMCIGNDISDFKRIQRNLEERERQFRALVENSPDIISRYDLDLRHVYISPAIEARTGQPAASFLGKTAEDLAMPPDQIAQWHTKARLLLETGQPQTIEFWGWMGGQERYNQVLLVPEYNEAGTKIEFIMGINRDLAGLKQVEQTLARRERQFRTLAENAPAMIMRFDLEKRYIYVNTSITNVSGLEASAFIGKTHHDLYFSEALINLWESSLDEVIQTGQSKTIEYHFEASDGLHYLQALYVPELNEAAELESVLCICHDITALKQAQLALEAEKERLSVTLGSIGEGVVATDTEGRIVVFNSRAATLTGCPSDKAIGQTFEQVVRLYDETVEVFLTDLVPQVLTKKKVLRLGTTPSISRQSIVLRPYSVDPPDEQADPDMASSLLKTVIEGRASPIFPASATQDQPLGVVFVFEDISQRRRLEEELQKAEKLQAVGVLAGGIAHDFNNFLAAVLGNLAFIRRSIGTQHRLYKNLLEAESACLNARNLTQQLLTFAKGGAPIKKDLAIAELLTDTANFMLRGTNIQCEFEIASDLWWAEIDEGQISQVFQNLVLNAQQAMPQGGVVRLKARNVLVGSEDLTAVLAPGVGLVTVLTTSPHNLVMQPGPYLQIELADQGVGIPAQYLTSVFDPYFTTKQQGNGLGLSICYSIVKNHQGYIAVESQSGVGTSFYVYLPAILPTTVEAPVGGEAFPLLPAAATQAPPTAAHRSLRVLVMDDQQMILELLQDVLVDAGHRVDLTHDGAAAIKCYEAALATNDPYQVVIVDLTIPGKMGGKEALEHLRQLDPQIRAIVASGYSNDPITSNYAKHGFAAVLPKPFDIDELVAVVERVAHSPTPGVRLA